MLVGECSQLNEEFRILIARVIVEKMDYFHALQPCSCPSAHRKHIFRCLPCVATSCPSAHRKHIFRCLPCVATSCPSAHRTQIFRCNEVEIKGGECIV